MPRYIDADKAFTVLTDYYHQRTEIQHLALKEALDRVQTADVVERKVGEWTEKEVIYAEEAKAIVEWQSCKCSVCGRYDTRPYMYYFTNPHYCSWCGAKMKGEGE